ncbi:MAG: hypothetical protein LBG19_10610 [Prevotellaceae bacterium]|jgi:hypothetical protein|nr:hypothetical protein [Prevotellaceae bacterium]
MTTISLTAPRSWEDLTQKQLEFVSKCYLKKLTREEFLSICFLKFTNCQLCWRANKWQGIKRIFYLKHKRNKFSLTAEEFGSFCERLAFLVDSIGLTTAPKIGKLIAPNYQLYEVTLDEYLIADTHYLAYSATEKDEHLSKMIATLWRPANTSFNEDNIERRARKLRLKPEVKKAIYIWYSGVKAWLKEKYPLVFTNPDSASDIPGDERIMGLLRMLNGGKPQDNPEVLKTQIHEILFELNQRIEENQKQKRYATK